MKDNKLERVRQSVLMLRQQFLQSDAGVFDQVLGEQEIAAMVRREIPHQGGTDQAAVVGDVELGLGMHISFALKIAA